LREYETTFIVQPEISEEGSQALLVKLDGILESGGATRLMCEDHGKRKLAYEIKKFHKGHYYTLMFLDSGKIVPEVERALRLEESVLRFLTIQAEAEVTDVEQRKVDAAEKEVEQAKRAAERAAREAEEAQARREADEAAEREAAERGDRDDADSSDGESEARARSADAADGSGDEDEEGGRS